MTRSLRFTPATLALLATGCAVLTVDVDVYKGPLIDHMCVQTQRLAAMASGARPALEQLRDQLEADERGTSLQRTRSMLITLDKKYREKNEWIDPTCFESRDAHVAQAVLDLYEDERNDNGKLRIILSRIDASLARLAASASVLRGDSGAERDFDARAAATLEVDPLAPPEQSATSALRRAYGLFVGARRFRYAAGVIDAAAKLHSNADRPGSKELRALLGGQIGVDNANVAALATKLTESSLAELTGTPTDGNGGGSTPEPSEQRLRWRTDVLYRVLEDSDLLDAHAQVLIKDAASRRVFVTRVVQIAAAYRESRETMSSLLDDLLDVLEIALDDDFGSPSERAELRRLAAGAVPELISPRRLFVSLSGATGDAWEFRAVERESVQDAYGTALADAPVAASRWSDTEWDTEQYFGELATWNNLVRDAIAQRLADGGVSAVRELRAAHLAFRASAGFDGAAWSRRKDAQAWTRRCIQYNVPLSRRLGIVGTGETDAATPLLELTRAAARLAERLRRNVSRSPLGSARGKDGLDTLTRRYLIAAEDNSCSDGQWQRNGREQEALWDALARFGAQLESVASFARINDDNGGDIEQLVAVLQTLGATLRSQVDELRWRQQFDGADERRATYEREVIASAYRAAPHEAVDSAIGRLRTQSAAHGKLAKTESAAQTDAVASATKSNAAAAAAKRALAALTSPSWAPELDNVAKLSAVASRVRVTYPAAIAALQEDGQAGGRIDGVVISLVAVGTPPRVSKSASSLNASAKKGTEVCTAVIADLAKLLAAIEADVATLASLTDSDFNAAMLATEKSKRDALVAALRDLIAHLDAEGDVGNPAKARLTALAREFETLAAKATAQADAEAKHGQANGAKQALEVLEAAYSSAFANSSDSIDQLDWRAAETQMISAVAARKAGMDTSTLAKQRLTDAAITAASGAVTAAFAFRPGPPDVGHGIGKEDRKLTAREAFDRLIEYYKHQHVKAVALGGETSDVARRLQETIDLAEVYKSDLVYIRPAAAFLRSVVLPATLQRDANITWRNELGRHALRQIPGVGEALENNDRDIKTLLELDKQAWQNINRVRVAGGGDTNYVVAKDDIGNWYVKNYSSDPSDIIKSAQSLALYGMSDELGTDLLARRSADAGDGEHTPVVSVPRKQLRKFRKTYREDAKKHHEELLAAAEKLPETLLGAINASTAISAADKKELEKQLEPAVDAIQKVVSDDKEITTDIATLSELDADRHHADRAARVLSALLTFHDSAQEAVTRAGSAIDDDEVSAVAAAQAAVSAATPTASNTTAVTVTPPATPAPGSTTSTVTKTESTTQTTTPPAPAPAPVPAATTATPAERLASAQAALKKVQEAVGGIRKLAQKQVEDTFNGFLKKRTDAAANYRRAVEIISQSIGALDDSE